MPDEEGKAAIYEEEMCSKDMKYTKKWQCRSVEAEKD